MPLGRLAPSLLLVVTAASLTGCASTQDYTACSDRGDVDAAIAACSRVIRTEKARRLFAWLGYTGPAGPFELAAAHRVRGIRYLEKGAFADARDDFAATLGLNPEDRDAKFGRELIIRRADQLLFGTDVLMPEQSIPQFELLESLKFPDEVRYKVYRGNAIKLLKLAEDKK